MLPRWPAARTEALSRQDDGQGARPGLPSPKEQAGAGRVGALAPAREARLLAAGGGAPMAALLPPPRPAPQI